VFAFEGLALWDVGGGFAVDVFGLDAGGLAEAHAGVVDGGEEGAEAGVAEGAQQQFDLAAGEHMGQRFLAGDLDLLPDVPAALEVAVVEVAQAAERLVDGAACEAAPVLGLEVDEEVEDVVGGEVGGVLPRVVAGDLARPVEVDVAGPFRDPYELDIAPKLGIPWLRCGTVSIVCFFS
jgi:hypothetical protein